MAKRAKPTRKKKTPPRPGRRAAKLSPIAAAVQGYIDGVLSGAIPACRFVRLAVERHVRDLAEASARGLVFDAESAERPIRFFGFLRHSKGEWAGQLFALSPWQQFILWAVFGWKHRASGLRRYRTAYIEIPRKNGKSTFLAGIGLYLLVADGEGGAEIYTAATKREQARIIHGEAVRMVRASKELQEIIGEVRDNLSVSATNSKYEPLGADSKTADGLNPHAALIDELHAHPDGGMYDILDTAMGARRQPLLLAITTAGHDRQSICWEQRERARRALEATAPDQTGWDDTLFAFIATLDEADDFRDPAVWPKANPNLGVSVKPDYLANQVRKSETSPRYANAVKRLHFDVWTEQQDRWLDMDLWRASAGPPLAWPAVRDELRGLPCCGGLDLSSKIDLAAFSLVFRHGDLVRCLMRYWIPEETAAAAEARDRVPYRHWAELGLIALTPGNVIDYGYIERDIRADFERYRIQEIGFDPWNATQTATNLGNWGLTMVELPQTLRTFTEPVKELEALVKAGKFCHNAHPILAWNAENVAVKSDPNDNCRPVKPEHGSTKRIDGIVAVLMGLARLLRQRSAGGAYDDHDLRELDW